MATYSEDGTWMWSEEHSKWIPSPPSSNNAIDSTTSTENKNLCKNCGKMIYKGWDKCTSCGVFVESFLKDTSNTKPFEYEFNNPFQKGKEEITSSPIKRKINNLKDATGSVFEKLLSIFLFGLKWFIPTYTIVSITETIDNSKKCLIQENLPYSDPCESTWWNLEFPSVLQVFIPIIVAIILIQIIWKIQEEYY